MVLEDSEVSWTLNENCRVTKAILQRDYEPQLLYKAPSLKLLRCTGFIFPFPLSIAALCLLNFFCIFFPFDFSLVLLVSSILFNQLKLPPASFLFLNTFWHSWLNFPEESLTWRVVLYPLLPRSISGTWYPSKLSMKSPLSFSMISPLALSLLLPSLLHHSILFLLQMSVLSSAASSLDSSYFFQTPAFGWYADLLHLWHRAFNDSACDLRCRYSWVMFLFDLILPKPRRYLVADFFC